MKENPSDNRIPNPEQQQITQTEAPRLDAQETFDITDLQHETQLEQAQNELKAQEIAKRLKDFDPVAESNQSISPDKQHRIALFQEKYTPSHLSEKREHGTIGNKVLDFFVKHTVERKGVENLPERGPFLVVSNHFDSDSHHLLALLKNFDTHLAASATIHWQRSPLFVWFLKKMRALAVPESLAHLSNDDKNALLERIPDGFTKNQYQKVIEQESTPDATAKANLNFIRNTLALLTRGDVVAIYPEGLWLYEGGKDNPRAQSLYQGYPGMEVIALKTSVDIIKK
jgi:hypothetical protein